MKVLKWLLVTFMIYITVVSNVTIYDDEINGIIFDVVFVLIMLVTLAVGMGLVWLFLVCLDRAFAAQRTVGRQVKLNLLGINGQENGRHTNSIRAVATK